MKRKFPVALAEAVENEDFKPQLKKNKQNNYKVVYDPIKPLNSNESMRYDNKPIFNCQMTTERLPAFLTKSQKPKNQLAKENLINTGEVKLGKGIQGICKSVGTNSDTMSDYSKDIGRQDLKVGRRNSKRMKTEEPEFEIKAPLRNKRITKNQSNSNKAKATKTQKQEGKKSKQKQNIQAKKRASATAVKAKVMMNYDPILNNSSLVKTSTFSVQVFEQEIASDLHPLESLLSIFDDIPVPDFGARVLPRRNPEENKWLKRMEQDSQNRMPHNENLLADKLARLSRPLKRDAMSSKSRKESESSQKRDDQPRKLGLSSLNNIPLRTIMTRSSSRNSIALANQNRNDSGFASLFGSMLRNSSGKKSSLDGSAKTSRWYNGSGEMEAVRVSLFEENNNVVMSDKKMIVENQEELCESMSGLIEQENHNIEEVKKEKEELAKKIEVMEYEKIYLLKEAQEKEENLKKKEEEVENIRKQLVLSEFYRINLHNYIQDLRGNLRIFCKVKPLTDDRKLTVAYPQKQHCVSEYQFDLNNTSNRFPGMKINSLEIGSSAEKKSIFYFDRVFDEISTQEDIFEEILPFIQSAVDGERVCILAYGQTGSGKTHTMEGPNLDEAKSITIDSGILPRAVDFIFKEIKRLEVQNNNIELQMACMEIYNENLSDLLCFQDERLSIGPSISENKLSVTFKDKLKAKDKEKDSSEKDGGKLTITFAANKVVVSGLTWIPIKDNQQLFSLVRMASKTRVTDKTSWNEKSSRSHCIYKLKLIRSDGKEGILSIVDLAGSERADTASFETKSVVEVSRMKKVQTEANYINKSLTTLGRILRLISEKKPENNIPYRESKLTRILQDSLGGGGKTLMFINICPSEENLFQSKESLKFSVKASL